MKVVISPSSPMGRLKAIASKSMAHRALICAAFGHEKCRIMCEETNNDISATAQCLSALGAKIEREAGCYTVTPITSVNKGATLCCGESGSTLRFLLPVACMLGSDSSFLCEGRLPSRPLSPLREELERCGATLSLDGSNPITCQGKLNSIEFSIAGNVSSQFISGLLFAIALSGQGGSVSVIGKLESEPYVELTVEMLRVYGVNVVKDKNKYIIAQNQKLISPKELYVEGDWSAAAFLLAMGAVGKNPISVCGLDINSPQGDREIISLLSRFGAGLTITEDTVTVTPAQLHGIEIDASEIPDLVPVLATVAAVAKGRTVIYNASRLRLKESDRLLSTSSALNTLGAKVTVTADGLIIDGVERLVGGAVSSFGDHRIAMSAAVASLVCRNAVEIDGAEAVAKSYPDFWQHARLLGIDFKQEF